MCPSDINTKQGANTENNNHRKLSYVQLPTEQQCEKPTDNNINPKTPAQVTGSIAQNINSNYPVTNDKPTIPVISATMGSSNEYRQATNNDAKQSTDRSINNSNKISIMDINTKGHEQVIPKITVMQQPNKDQQNISILTITSNNEIVQQERALLGYTDTAEEVHNSDTERATPIKLNKDSYITEKQRQQINAEIHNTYR